MTLSFWCPENWGWSVQKIRCTKVINIPLILLVRVNISLPVDIPVIVADSVGCEAMKQWIPYEQGFSNIAKPWQVNCKWERDGLPIKKRSYRTNWWLLCMSVKNHVIKDFSFANLRRYSNIQRISTWWAGITVNFYPCFLSNFMHITYQLCIYHS